jgi:hypothetical protein
MTTVIVIGIALLVVVVVVAWFFLAWESPGERCAQKRAYLHDPTAACGPTF